MHRRAHLLLLPLPLTWLCAAACGTAQPTARGGAPLPDEPAPQDGAPGHVYEVREGDTLYAIARRHGTTVEDLVDVNGLDVDAPIRPGQALFLPDPGPLAAVAAVEERPSAPPPATPAPAGDAALAWPLDEGVLLRDFDRGGAVPHEGVLFAAPEGTPVRASGDGEVLFVGDQGTAYGLLVVLRHRAVGGAGEAAARGGADDELVTVYAHLQDAPVAAGAHVRRGDVIGRVGRSGKVEAPRLHFQVRRGRTPIDPLSVLPPP